MKLEPPNPLKMIKFMAYAILADHHLSIAFDYALNKRKEKNGMNLPVSRQYHLKAFEYAQKAGKNRNEGMVQTVLDKLFI